MHVQSCFCANLTSCFFAVLADVSVVVAPYLFILFSRASPLIFIAGATNGKGDTGNELEKITMDQTLLLLLLLLWLFSFLTSLALDKKCRLVRSSRALRNKI